MKIVKEASIDKSVDDAWEVLGVQFGGIDKWASYMRRSELSGELDIGGVRALETAGGPVKQQLTSFDPEQHSLAYKAIAGSPFFAKSTNVKWSLAQNTGNNAKLTVGFEIVFKGITVILTPVVKKKLGKVIDEMLQEFKFFVENGQPHPRKIASK